MVVLTVIFIGVCYTFDCCGFTGQTHNEDNKDWLCNASFKATDTLVIQQQPTARYRRWEGEDGREIQRQAYRDVGGREKRKRERGTAVVTTHVVAVPGGRWRSINRP